MNASAVTRRSLIVVFAIAAVATFLLAAAASTIVAQADGPGEREAAFASNSIVVNDVGQPIGSAPVGARVPSLVDVTESNIFSAAQLESSSSDEGQVKTVQIGISESEPAALANAFLNHSERWLPATSSEPKRVRAASMDAGVRLRRLGVSALILPTGFLAASSYGCAIAEGLYFGGAVPIFRLPSAGTTDTIAIRKCLARFANRDATVFVDHRSSKPPELVLSPESKLTMFFETTPEGLDSALLGGAAGVLVEGQSREETARRLTLSRSEEQTKLVLNAATKMSRWFAKVPPIGTIPPTTAPAAQKKAKRTKLKSFEDITPTRKGNDGRPVAPRQQAPAQPDKGNTNPSPVPPSPESGGAGGPDQ